MPVEVSTRLFLPGRHSVVITATDSFQKRAEKVVQYTLKQGPVNGMHFVIHRVLLKVSITKLLRYSRTVEILSHVILQCILSYSLKSVTCIQEHKHFTGLHLVWIGGRVHRGEETLCTSHHCIHVFKQFCHSVLVLLCYKETSIII